jgi:glycosyltransferase involved in cell wall biosynthesis
VPVLLAVNRRVAKISILLPSLNAREFLTERVDSLRNQTFPGWEAIVLDSGSRDGTWEYFQSVAANDSRFRLHQIPREGLYAALNRGLELVAGEFLHVATADDSMVPEFLAEMLDAFTRFPEAGIAACDARLINRNGTNLSRQDLLPHLTLRAARTLLRLDHVRTAFSDERPQHTNYRRVPHDCLLHFDGRSVYFSLNQLLLQTNAARAAGPFQTNIGSVADFDWLLRLTSTNATIHVPKKLALWRFHGNQLSLKRDESRASARRTAAERALQKIQERYPLSDSDCAALLLPLNLAESSSPLRRVSGWLESLALLVRMLLRRPFATLRALMRTRFRFGTRRHTLLPMIFEGFVLKPETLTTESGKRTL